MNYYNPNFYQNYQPQYMPQQAQMPSMLNGKLVDSIEAVKAADVPFGGYGVFPKADMTEVYIKTWNQNGTTNTLAYRPYTPEPAQDNTLDMATVLERFESLETKLDSLLKGVKYESNSVNATHKTEF